MDIDGWAVQMERDMRRAKVQHRAQTITAAPVCGLTQMDHSTASNSHEEIRALPRMKEHPLPLQTQTCISETSIFCKSWHASLLLSAKGGTDRCKAAT